MIIVIKTLQKHLKKLNARIAKLERTDNFEMMSDYHLIMDEIENLKIERDVYIKAIERLTQQN